MEVQVNTLGELRQAARWVQDLVELERTVFEVCPYADYLWEESHFRHELPAKWTLSFVARQAERVIGFWVASQPTPARVHIHRVAVHPQWWGTGVAQQLHDAFLAVISAQPTVRESTLSVSAQGRRALHFYLRQGFDMLTGEALQAYCLAQGRGDRVHHDRLEDRSGYCRHILHRTH